MNARLASVILASSLAVGFGAGFGIGLADQPFVLEASGTPFGSFILRCNLPQMLPPASLPRSGEDPLLWHDHIA